MGKTRHKKVKSFASQPTGLPSVKDMEDQEENLDSVPATVCNLIEKLQSVSPEERECTCSTITALVEQPGNINHLLNAKIVRVLGPLLVDPSWSIRKAAVGALRNISVGGGTNACIEMVKQDIMTPVIALLKQYEVDWKPVNKKEDLQLEVFDQTLHLLSNICEGSEVAVKIFTQHKFFPILLQCLNYEVYGFSISHVAAQCLYTVAEDNTDFKTLMSTPNAAAPLENILASHLETSKLVMLKALSAGILYNSSLCQLPTLQAKLIDVLSRILDYNIESRLLAIDTMQRSIMSNGGLPDAAGGVVVSDGGDMHTDCGDSRVQSIAQQDRADTDTGSPVMKAVDTQVEDAMCVMTAQQISLELLANMCCNEDEEDVWEDSDDTSVEESDACDEMDDNEQANLSSLCLEGEICTAFVSCGIFKKVLSKANRPSEELCTSLSSKTKTSGLIKRLDEILQSSLLCLTNLITGLSIDALGGLSDLHELWGKLAGMAASQQTGSFETMEAITRAMHAVVTKLQQAQSPKLAELTESDLEFLYKINSSSSSEEVRANCLRIVSAIGQYLSKPSPPHKMMMPIGQFLLQSITNEKELWVVAEALDAMMDVFAEDHLNVVLKELQILPTLTAILPQLKLKLRQQKQTLGENLPVVMTVKTNLSRFISYKSKLLK